MRGLLRWQGGKYERIVRWQGGRFPVLFKGEGSRVRLNEGEGCVQDILA